MCVWLQVYSFTMICMHLVLQVYWFTVEFGVMHQDGEMKVYGAGLLSAYGELQHAMSGKPQIKRFEASQTALQEYDDKDYQPVYFICESFDKMKENLRYLHLYNII